MKKFNLDPLSLDKKTIAMLDQYQLQAIVGGLNGELACPSGSSDPGFPASTGCGSGNSTCGGTSGSIGCGAGGSTC